MKIFSFYTNSPLRNFNHCIYCQSTDSFYVFDPLDLKKIEELINTTSAKSIYLLNTHNHYDHIGQNDDFISLYNATKIDVYDQQEIYLDNDHYLKVINTPGHINPHYCYLIRKKSENVGLICGDTIFNSGVGNCKNGGDVEQLYESIQYIYNLDDEITLYPSHDYFETNLLFSLSIEPQNTHISKELDKYNTYGYSYKKIGDEKLYNPFLRLEQLQKLAQFNNMSKKQIFIKLRSLRDNW
ncbi:MAG: hypothetical protein N4A33_04445 [Bacteriovoracaceae bacterium]|jgi:hydroxyacylglutathione hydrolase|nr:hypothetical protein [Bacteriovoracaceae bacterium]